MSGDLINNRGQVWIETVIYTLIGLAIIGLVLAVAKPAIDEKKDEVIIEQSIESLENINDKIFEVQRATGNSRAIDLKIGKGRLIFDVENDKISWIIESRFEYSEIDSTISLGNVDVHTRESTPYEVGLSMNYEMDIRFGDQETGVKELGAAPTNYKLIIKNTGINEEEKIIIEIREA